MKNLIIIIGAMIIGAVTALTGVNVHDEVGIHWDAVLILTGLVTIWNIIVHISVWIIKRIKEKIQNGEFYK